MSTHKHFDKICYVVLAATLILMILFMNAEKLGVQKASSSMDYDKKLFDTSTVHTINIVMDDWDDFIESCKSEEYYTCTLEIDGEVYKNVAIRGKGNTSLMQVESYGNDRYSFKVEFDHYDSTRSYYGLDKLALNNIIQDNTYMKDYLTYQMMADMGVASPLCSYVYITLNGEDWGLYLAVEGVEDSFLQRNYGKDYGELYKPDSMSMGGGRGNGEKFDLDKFLEDSEAGDENNSNSNIEKKESSEWKQRPMGQNSEDGFPQMSDGQIPSGEWQKGEQMPEDNRQKEGQRSGSERQKDGNQGGFGGMKKGSDDVLLKYIDDDPESYANIFDNVKTDISASDKARLIESLKKLSNGEELSDTVDIEAVIRYFVVHNFVVNFDSYTGAMIHNYYLYEKDGQMQMIPWDYNLAFGGFQSMEDATSLVNYPIDSPISGSSTNERPMIAWIFENEEYTELYHQYFSEYIADYFESGYFEQMMDEVSAMIAPYVEKDPTKFCTYEEFETAISTLREFCLLRAESIRGQLDGTIGATSKTQNSDTFIDAGDLQISNMGSMGFGMNGGGITPPGGMEMPEGMEFPDDMEFPGGGMMPSEGGGMPFGNKRPE